MSPARHLCYHTILYGPHLEVKRSACVEVDDEGVVVGVGAGRPPGVAERVELLMPLLVNAHAHLLDYAVAELGEDRGLGELVSHPSGLKYEALRSTPRSRLEEALVEALEAEARLGVGYSATYVELGWEFMPVVRRASAWRRWPRLTLLPQPPVKSLEAYLEAVVEFLGAGLDTAFDLQVDELKLLLGEARSRGGLVQVHVAETPELASRGDYQQLLDAGAGEETVAVHLTHVDAGVLGELASRGVGLVFCPTSNLYHEQALPPLPEAYELWRRGELSRVGLGTDNAAWIGLDPALEARLAYMAYHGEVRGSTYSFARFLLRAATVGGAEVLKVNYRGIVEGEPLAALEVRMPVLKWSSSPHASIVKRLAEHPRKLVNGVPDG